MNVSQILRKLNSHRVEQTHLTIDEWLHRANLKTSTYYRWTHGETRPNISSLDRLAKAVGLRLKLEIEQTPNPLR
jgi:predicted transcriptional regulator